MAADKVVDCPGLPGWQCIEKIYASGKRAGHIFKVYRSAKHHRVQTLAQAIRLDAIDRGLSAEEGQQQFELRKRQEQVLQVESLRCGGCKHCRNPRWERRCLYPPTIGLQTSVQGGKPKRRRHVSVGFRCGECVYCKNPSRRRGCLAREIRLSEPAQAAAAVAENVATSSSSEQLEMLLTPGGAGHCMCGMKIESCPRAQCELAEKARPPGLRDDLGSYGSGEHLASTILDRVVPALGWESLQRKASTGRTDLLCGMLVSLLCGAIAEQRSEKGEGDGDFLRCLPQLLQQAPYILINPNQVFKKADTSSLHKDWRGFVDLATTMDLFLDYLERQPLCLRSSQGTELNAKRWLQNLRLNFYVDLEDQLAASWFLKLGGYEVMSRTLQCYIVQLLRHFGKERSALRRIRRFARNEDFLAAPLLRQSFALVNKKLAVAKRVTLVQGAITQLAQEQRVAPSVEDLGSCVALCLEAKKPLAAVQIIQDTLRSFSRSCSLVRACLEMLLLLWRRGGEQLKSAKSRSTKAALQTLQERLEASIADATSKYCEAGGDFDVVEQLAWSAAAASVQTIPLSAEAQLRCCAEVLERRPIHLGAWRLLVRLLCGDAKPAACSDLVAEVWQGVRLSLWSKMFWAVPVRRMILTAPAFIKRSLILLAAFLPDGGERVKMLLEAFHEQAAKPPQRLFRAAACPPIVSAVGGAGAPVDATAAVPEVSSAEMWICIQHAVAPASEATTTLREREARLWERLDGKKAAKARRARSRSSLAEGSVRGAPSAESVGASLSEREVSMTPRRRKRSASAAAASDAGADAIGGAGSARGAGSAESVSASPPEREVSMTPRRRRKRTASAAAAPAAASAADAVGGGGSQHGAASVDESIGAVASEREVPMTPRRRKRSASVAASVASRPAQADAADRGGPAERDVRVPMTPRRRRKRSASIVAAAASAAAAGVHFVGGGVAPKSGGVTTPQLEGSPSPAEECPPTDESEQVQRATPRRRKRSKHEQPPPPPQAEVLQQTASTTALPRIGRESPEPQPPPTDVQQQRTPRRRRRKNTA
eukprot:TRINITY_DN20816_c0_g2_i11.p1 TRINITY_DN20816_c0_g2~~TRINITY_DN20816_c0_g2_i11.p1  ORF type:complete len:1053 (-),score=221.00 TRINITY_DN20816_c0_g2_i11:594-3752(-)